MNSRSLRYVTFALLTLLVLCSHSLAQRRATTVLGEGTGRDFWVAETFVDSDGVPMTSLRQRTNETSGKWSEIARVQDNVTGLAGLGDRLAVLSGGEWRMVWAGGGTAGTALPGERPINRIAADGDALWATGGPALYRWDADHGWADRGRLPGAAGAGAGSLAVRDGVPWIAYLTGKSLCVDRADNADWRRVAELPLTPTYKLLLGGPLPLLAWRDAAGVWTIYDLSAATPRVLRTVSATGASDVAIAGTSLRVVSITKDGISQQGFDDFGRGAAFGPDAIAQVAPALNHSNEWPNFFLMGLMTAALVVAMRSRVLPTADALAAAHVRVAPLGRRVAAGVIDAIPYLLAYAYVAQRLETSPFEPSEVPRELFLPILIGLAVYVLHVAAAELIFGRSIGKFLFRLRVVSVDGTPAAPGRIVLRNLMRVLDVALGLPFLFIILSPTGQRFGDMAARTLVVADLPDEKTA